MGTLRLSEIQNPSGTTAMTINEDTAGLSIKLRSAFRATRSSNDSDANFTVSPERVCVFNQTDFNIGSGYSTSTGKFTAPIAGVYFFHSHLYLSGADGASWVSPFFFINGSQRSRTIHDPQGGGYGHGIITDTFQLSANDYVEVRLQISGDTSVIFSGDSTGGVSVFTGHLIGVV
jgi:hypothetical protein